MLAAEEAMDLALFAKANATATVFGAVVLMVNLLATALPVQGARDGEFVKGGKARALNLLRLCEHEQVVHGTAEQATKRTTTERSSAE